MYPIMLPGDTSFLAYRDETSSIANPDGIRQQVYGTPPDPLGRIYLRILDGVAGRLSSLRLPRLKSPFRRRPATRLV